MTNQVAGLTDRESLIERFRSVRARSEAICAPLETEDYQIQSIIETSPPKWHIAHVTWFFETFVLPHFEPRYQVFDDDFAYLFNSYYETVGAMHPRPARGLLSRPAVQCVFDYRAYVDQAVTALIDTANEQVFSDLAFRIELGLNHEQQHQELLLMDIKHNLSVNPLRPAYREDLVHRTVPVRDARWIERSGELREIGHDGDGFAFDNETPRHHVLTRDHLLADRLITNGEYLEFIVDGGYDDPALWLADGWFLIRDKGWRHPLYWEQRGDEWHEFTLGGLRAMDPGQPVCHISYYEADAFARWAGKRLPLEEELESVLDEQPVSGNFVENDNLHPQTAGGSGQWWGDLWCWTASPYSPHPRFKPLEGSMGEYNGKFMANQMVLKGGCCATPVGHVRASYRNFFYPHDRWAFGGIRLAADA